MSCEDHPKLNWVVGCSGLPTRFLTMIKEWQYYILLLEKEMLVAKEIISSLEKGKTCCSKRVGSELGFE